MYRAGSSLPHPSRRRLITAAVTLVASFVAHAIATPTASALPAPHPWDVDYSSWMSDHRDVLEAKRLVDIPIPGTHDTLMYDASFDLSPDAPFDVETTLTDAFADCPSSLEFSCDPVLNDLLALAVPLGDLITYQWGRTQSRDLTQQLEDGIRSFDFRVCRKTNGSLYGCHGVYTLHDIAWHLAQIRAFMESHGDEILFIGVSVVSGGGWADENDMPYDRQDLANLITDALGPWLVSDPSLIARPMSDIWDGDGRVFVFSSDFELRSDSGFAIHFSGDYNIGSWPNSSDAQYMREAVLANLGARAGVVCDSDCGGPNPDKLFSLSSNLTPQTSDIILGLVAQMLEQSSSLRDLWLTTMATGSVFGFDDDLLDAVGGDPLDPRVPMGVDDVELSDGSVRRGMWGKSMDATYAPVLDAVSRDPDLRRNFNRMSVDHYQRVPGYVAAMVALATSDHREDNLLHNGEPALTVASRSGFIGIPPALPYPYISAYVEQLPSAQRTTLLDYDARDESRFSPGANGLGGDVDADATGVDVESFRRGGADYTVVGWGEIPVATSVDDEDRFVRTPIRAGTVHIGLLSAVGDESLATVRDTFTLSDAVGSPTLEVHDGRLWIAYPRFVDNALRIRLVGAPLDAFLASPGFAAFDIDTLLADATTTIVPVVPAWPLCVTDHRLVYPQPALASDGSRLVLAWTSRVDAQGLACSALAGALPGALTNAGDVRWAPIVIGADSAALGTIRTVNGASAADGYTPYSMVDAQAVGGRIFVGSELVLGNRRDRTVSEIGSASSSEVWEGDVVLPVFDLPGPRLALGAWADDLVIALGGQATPYDPVTLAAVGEERELSSSRAPIALAAPPLNQPPVADVGGPYATGEGTPIALDASASTDPEGDPLTFEWDLDGDGQFDDATGVAPQVTFGQDGLYAVSVRVSDGTLFGVASAIVTVSNVAPTLEVPSITGADAEGGVVTVFAPFSDPGGLDVHTCTVSWGDGSPPEVGTVTAGVCSGFHVYADNGGFVVTVEIDDGVASDGQSRTTSISNVPPTVAPIAPLVVNEGATIPGITVTFTDPGTADRHTATVDWGSGPVPAVVTEAPYGPPGSVAGLAGSIALPAHGYSNEFSGLVPVCVYDDDGGSHCIDVQVTVSNVVPTITGLRLDASHQNEGDTVEATVDFSDPGDDAHAVIVNWGDGSAEAAIAVPAGARSVTFSHVWLDDDPSGTAADRTTVSVAVVDGAGSSFPAHVETTISNVAPEIRVGLDATSIDENGVVQLGGSFTDPSSSGGAGDSFEVSIDWGDGTPADTGAIPAGGARTISGSHQYFDDGRYGVTVTVTDDDTGSTTTDAIWVDVANVAPSVIAPVPETIPPTQYSDPFEGSIVFVATDVLGYDTALETLTATATLDGQPLPAELVLGAAACASIEGPGQSCTWTITGTAGGQLLLPPGEHVVELSVSDDDGGVGDASVALEITQEDARATYTGPVFIGTTSAEDSTAIVELRATIQDISLLIGDLQHDAYPGDIRNAEVEFVDRDGGVLCTATTVSLLFAGSEQLATASCDWNVEIRNANSEVFQIGIVIGGYYVGNTGAEDTVVTVSKPLDGFITGGGYFAFESLGNAAGVYGQSTDGKANFGFNAKFNKNGTRIQGRATIIVRSGGRTYQIKSNAIDSLGIYELEDGSSAAEFEAKANVSDVTDPNETIGLGGNLRLQLRMTDVGQSADIDTIAWTLYDTDGALLYSSHWTGVTSAEQPATGNLSVQR